MPYNNSCTNYYDPACHNDSVTITVSNVGGPQSVFCAVSNQPEVYTNWTNWKAVFDTTPALCDVTGNCDSSEQPQTATGSAVILAPNNINVAVLGLWRPAPGDSGEVKVVCGLQIDGYPASCPDQPVIMLHTLQPTCFPGDSLVRRLDPSTSALVEARMDSLALGDTLECWKPEVDLGQGKETGYTKGTCKVRSLACHQQHLLHRCTHRDAHRHMHLVDMVSLT